MLVHVVLSNEYDDDNGCVESRVVAVFSSVDRAQAAIAEYTAKREAWVAWKNRQNNYFWGLSIQGVPVGQILGSDMVRMKEWEATQQKARDMAGPEPEYVRHGEFELESYALDQWIEDKLPGSEAA